MLKTSWGIKLAALLAVVLGAVLLAGCDPAQNDLMKALNDENQLYAQRSQFQDDYYMAHMHIDPSLDWGGKLLAFVGDAQVAGDQGLVCLQETSPSGTTYAIARVVKGGDAGTYFGKSACPAAPTPANLDHGWNTGW